MSTAPMQHIGIGYYKSLVVQPREFWIRNELPAAEMLALEHLSLHRSRDGVRDIDAALGLVAALIWWHFDAPKQQRLTHPFWRGQRNFVISPRGYCTSNQLPEEESTAIHWLCNFTCRDHLAVVADQIEKIRQRDYAQVRAIPAGELNYSDVLYLAKEQLENNLTLLEARAVLTPAYRGKLKGVIDRVTAAWQKCGWKAQ